MRRKFLPPVFLLCLCAYSQGQAWSGIIDPSRATNWAANGVGATIVNRTTICSTAACNALTGAGVTGANITAAINSAPANSVVLLPAGTFSMGSVGISIKGTSNITLRGAGPGQTILNFTTGSSDCNGDICVIDNAGEWYEGSAATQPGGSNAAQVTSGYTQGSTQIVVNNVGSAGLSVGTMIIMDQADDTAVGAGLFVCDTASVCHQTGQTEGSYNGRTIGGVDYNQTQVFIITAINNSSPYSSSSPQLTLSNPVYGTNWRSSQNVGIWWPSISVIQGVGIENMTLNHASSTSSQAGIYLYNCYDCWVKNIVDTYSNRDHIWFYQTKNVTVRDSYFFGTQNITSESYGIEDLLSSDYLIENNIFQQVAAPLIGAGGSGGVMGYNFWVNNLYQPGTTPTWNEATFMSHDAGNEFKLMEGNEGTSMNMDDIHGMGGIDTFFRNQVSGRGYNGATSPATLTTNNTNAFYIYFGWRGENIIGNVLGYGGYFTIYQTDTTVSGGQTQCNASIYALGWGWSNCQVDSGGPQTDPLVESTLLRWGNYDTVTGAVRWCGNSSDPGWSTTCGSTSEIPTSGVSYISGNSVPSSTTLPDSFYLSGQPSWWQFPNASAPSPFPAIGPDVTGGTVTAGNSSLGGHAYPIPAANCYYNVMGGSADGSGGVLTTFDADTCYGTGTAPPPLTPPTGLTAVVQ
jgi:hypothetical protein